MLVANIHVHIQVVLHTVKIYYDGSADTDAYTHQLNLSTATIEKSKKRFSKFKSKRPNMMSDRGASDVSFFFFIVKNT